MPNPQILLLDPPREGFADLNLFLKKFSSIRSIIYISCDLATFTQDLKKVKAQVPNFLIKEVQPLDMFPQTHHIELMAHIQLDF